MLFLFPGGKMRVTCQEAVQSNRVSMACSYGFIKLPFCTEWVVGHLYLAKGVEDRLLITVECLYECLLKCKSVPILGVYQLLLKCTYRKRW